MTDPTDPGPVDDSDETTPVMVRLFDRPIPKPTLLEQYLRMFQ